MSDETKNDKPAPSDRRLRDLARCFIKRHSVA
jgi:hypothetical protein